MSMSLKSARFRHYKSLDDVSVDFSAQVTLLVGPNAVGKSNIVDGLRFVRDAVSVDLEHAVSSRGGIGRVRQYSRTKPFKVSIDLSFEQQTEQGPRSAHLDFSIASKSASNYVVDSERAEYVSENRREQTHLVSRLKRDASGAVRVEPSERRQSYKVPVDQLAVGLHAPMGLGMSAWPIERFIANWHYSAIYPNLLRQPAAPDKDAALNEDGRNWASVIKAQRRTARGKVALSRVVEAMKGVVPTFEDVTVSTVGSYLVPKFRFRVSPRETVEYDPVQLSDGTLRIFGILLALYQSPAPQLLVIEEPEQTVHPGVLGVLADAFREASETTQLIITTHSPHFVDQFDPDQVRVVTTEKGLTRVSAIKRTQIEAVKRHLMSMQDFMLAEGLLPEGA